MTNKNKDRDASKMSAGELRDAGVPFFVDPNDLTLLGHDPEQYFRTSGDWTAFMLDRVKDADLISRLSTMRDGPFSLNWSISQSQSPQALQARPYRRSFASTALTTPANTRTPMAMNIPQAATIEHRCEALFISEVPPYRCATSGARQGPEVCNSHARSLHVHWFDDDDAGVAQHP
jgi:hypothetical protein